MSISINTDVASMRIVDGLGSHTQKINDATRNLSTGLRINEAADDAANLSLSTNLNSKSSGLRVANNNIQTGLTKIQTIDGFLGGMTENLHRVKDLALQAANGVYSSSERALIDKEVQQLFEELKVSEKSANNEAGSDTMSLHIGETADAFMDISGLNLDFSTAMSVDLTSEANARTTMQSVETALNYILEKRAELGTSMNMLEVKHGINETRNYELKDSASDLQDADMAQEASIRTSNQIKQQSAVTLLQQAGQMKASAVLSLY